MVKHLADGIKRQSSQSYRRRLTISLSADQEGEAGAWAYRNLGVDICMLADQGWLVRAHLLVHSYGSSVWIVNGVGQEEYFFAK